ncbi:hypothetical protein D3C77_798790 [compost metagenome]
MAPLSTNVPVSRLLNVPLPLRLTPRVAVEPASTRTAVVPSLPLTRFSEPATPFSSA